MRRALAVVVALTAVAAGRGDNIIAGGQQTISQVALFALGGDHTCAVMDRGGIRCWGWNAEGQLGNSDKTSRTVPMDVVGLNGSARYVTAGSNHSCALLKTGSVKCWGSNASSQLGAETGLCGSFACSTTPVDVEGLSNVASVAAGYAHNCAVTTTGTLLCWGFNRYGQLGDGTRADRTAPAQIIQSGVAAAAPGDVQSCAMLTDHTARCWGNNLLGELGNGTTTESLTPVSVCADASCDSPLAAIAQLSAGDHHACAVNANGDVFCWGSNIVGQLGVATTGGCPDAGRPCAKTPVRVALLGPALAISAATASTCALLQNGTVQCWGQLLGSTRWPEPTIIERWTGATAMATAKGHACALMASGTLSCFGSNQQGQLGDGTTAPAPEQSPRNVWTLSGRGDADCDRNITSLDATLVLQLVAGLLEVLPCPGVTATDGQTPASTDALAILQFSAGLLT